MSGAGCRIDLGLLPVAGDTREYLRSSGRDPEILAATGGEDYELLIAASGEIVEALAAESETPVTVIGEITEEGVFFARDGEPVENLYGWDHFADE
jgi:thiamine-monophosphate kinase